jgi:hypothetical protein
MRANFGRLALLVMPQLLAVEEHSRAKNPQDAGTPGTPQIMVPER